MSYILLFDSLHLPTVLDLEKKRISVEMDCKPVIFNFYWTKTDEMFGISVRGDCLTISGLGEAELIKQPHLTRDGPDLVADGPDLTVDGPGHPVKAELIKQPGCKIMRGKLVFAI